MHKHNYASTTYARSNAVFLNRMFYLFLGQMSEEESTIIKDDSVAIEAELNTRSLHELARNGQLEGMLPAAF